MARFTDVQLKLTWKTSD